MSLSVKLFGECFDDSRNQYYRCGLSKMLVRNAEGKAENLRSIECYMSLSEFEWYKQGSRIPSSICAIREG